MIEVHFLQFRRSIQVDAPDAEAALWKLSQSDAVALEQLPNGSWDSFWLDQAKGLLYRMHARTKARALAKGFERQRAATNQPAPEMKVFDICLARTGERLKIEAEDWRSAVRQTGRADACYAQQEERPYGPFEGPSVTLWFDPDCPHGVGARTIEGAMKSVVGFLDSAARDKGAAQ